MTNLMQDAADWLGDRLQDEAGRAITYERSPSKKYTTTGVPRERIYRATSKQGLTTQAKVTDWLILTAGLSDLIPRQGDKITDAAGVTYAALPMGDMPCWEYEDNANITLVIHTKKVG